MRQCSAETDIERGQGSFCFLFQYGEKQALQDLELCSASSHSPALIHRIKSGRVTTVTTPSSPPFQTQEWHQCCHLSLSAQQHISEGHHHPLSKISAQNGPSGITQPGISLQLFHWDKSSIPQDNLHFKWRD